MWIESISMGQFHPFSVKQPVKQPEGKYSIKSHIPSSFLDGWDPFIPIEMPLNRIFNSTFNIKKNQCPIYLLPYSWWLRLYLQNPFILRCFNAYWFANSPINWFVNFWWILISCYECKRLYLIFQYPFIHISKSPLTPSGSALHRALSSSSIVALFSTSWINNGLIMGW